MRYVCQACEAHSHQPFFCFVCGGTRLNAMEPGGRSGPRRFLRQKRKSVFEVRLRPKA
jgi:hypothetical protein